MGQSDIVRRIVVNAPFGSNVREAHSTNADYVDCSNTTLSQMRWRLTDAVGRAVDLLGHGISFSICFLDEAVVLEKNTLLLETTESSEEVTWILRSLEVLSKSETVAVS